MKMEEVEGIGPIEAEKLALVGIVTAETLLDKGAKPGGRAAIERRRGSAPRSSSSGSTAST